jgi:hypothetical protein
VATKAMAAKLARLLYRMLRYGMKYVNQGAEFYEAQHRKQQVIYLKRKAAQMARTVKPTTHEGSSALTAQERLTSSLPSEIWQDRHLENGLSTRIVPEPGLLCLKWKIQLEENTTSQSPEHVGWRCRRARFTKLAGNFRQTGN